MLQLPPYIGISGITDFKVAEKLQVLAQQLHINLLFGLLVSHRQLDPATDGIHPDNPRYIPLDQLKRLPKTLASSCCIHYNTRNPKFTDEIGTLLDYTGMKSAIYGLQLNLSAIDPNELDRLRSNYPSLRIITQLRKSLLSDDPKQVSQYLQSVLPRVDYCLIDVSCGHGIQIDLQDALKIRDMTIYLGQTSCNIGIAGGISPKNVASVRAGFAKLLGTQNFSIDAETGLRTPTDQFDFDRAAAYLRAYTNYAQQFSQ